jgi:hypothetical protein
VRPVSDLRCITVRQPWATLLVDPTLSKTIETRSRRTNIRGTIGIIAGLWNPPDHVFKVGDYEMVRWFDLLGYGDGWKLQYPNAGDPGFPDDGIHPDLPFGALIGTVELYDCVPIVDDADDFADPVGCVEVTPNRTGLLLWPAGATEHEETRDVTDQLPYGDFTPGRWAWLTRNPVLFDEPRPMRGAQHWQTVTL